MWKCFAPQVPLLNTLIHGHCVNGKEGFACKLALHFFVVPGDVCHIRFLGTYITMQHGTVYASIICFPVPKCNVRLLLLNALPHLPHPIAMCSPDANTGKYLTVLLNNLAVIEMLYILAVLPLSPFSLRLLSHTDPQALMEYHLIPLQLPLAPPLQRPQVVCKFSSFPF